MKVLVVEDDLDVSKFICTSLKQLGYVVDVCHSGKQGLLQATTETYDAIILDRMLPELDGITLLKTIRATGSLVPVILLSAMAEVSHRVEGLQAGADDYLTKPFAFSELQARLDVMFRRATQEPSEQTVLHCDDLSLNLLTQEAKRDGVTINLQPREYRLLEYLLRHQDRVVTRTMLLEAVWDYHFDPQTNVIDVHISRLRNKVDKPFGHTLIHTIRGRGYVVKAAS
ncbi:XRE family transcriptional regulator [Marinomonas sp. S3726]|uniref:response regulator transcription factor n=1 Tax=Marinomonas sp. S3726 TaxID=579484 RepID=UPI0005F9E86A|nr:response regulator transcription factor [Marinomonas sp. S3726]KJZ08181.1 XRE family transcriptional regulator [Marinomonas sp. S3726]